MTDKEQIIIDGVDVSECVHYEDLSCTSFRDSCGYPLDCKDFFFCNYKQLARKTQECEELKEENQKLEMQLCNEYGERDDYNIPCKMIRDLDYGLQKEIEENDKYLKALERIEYEATEKLKALEADTDTYGCLMKILNIINEVKRETLNE